MSNATPDPRCPECGEPIGQTATYCMHCSADLTDEREAADADEDGVWDGTEPASPGEAETIDSGGTAETIAAQAGGVADAAGIGTEDGQLLDPDGFVDNALTVVVGIAGGIIVGIVGTIVLTVATASGWGLLFGVLLWLGSTAYLVRRRTVQGAVSRTAYAVALVLLLVPLIALSPVIEASGGLQERGTSFVSMLLFVLFPAAIAAGVGWVAGRFVPSDAAGTDG
ncbi:zinc ribbon domain-containing protein [Halapricum hydrolyticum]|uniref:Zinc-ribbon domain-containing protein n=1 Tax=Halapricum hydrolyticum TaxID=2979991 RepID=A0AAE3ID73_9EURY|nr:zinc ribbon domain-containing protein [Halapricum hydrolyticum]MCU4719434.1 zinc-ribbon domain-containing protein [Halapricum hydrolyticum]MCU4728443.1 zinc-ribbon domain-containing protein [Halapricum hydrolyticum]